MKTFTLVIPAYNEQQIIYNNIMQTIDVLDNISDNVNLVVLNDGSTDGTKLLLEIAKEHSDGTFEIKNMKEPSRRENLIKFMDTITTDYVGYMDCDLATDLSYLPRLFKYSKDYDIVSGSRHIVSSDVKRSTQRKIISFLFNNMVRILFNSKIRDHECGFKMFKTSVFKQLVKKTGVDNKDRKMFWDSEMWIYAQLMGFSILEFPIKWREGKKSALRFKTELSMIKYIIKFWMSNKWKTL